MTNQNATQEDLSHGMEADVIYNPLRNWTLKLTVGKQMSTYTQVGAEMTDWLNAYLPVFQSAKATDMPALVTQYNAQPLSLRNFWNGYGFGDATWSASTGVQSYPTGYYYGAMYASIYNAILAQGTQVPNERVWSANLISNYAFDHGPLKGLSVGGGYRWAERAIAGYYANSIPAPSFTRQPGWCRSSCRTSTGPSIRRVRSISTCGRPTRPRSRSCSATRCR